MEVFPTMLVQMVKIGEETGNIEDMMDKVAEYYEMEVNAATDALPTVPWWTIPVTEATVYITSYVEMPHLEDAGWTKADTTDFVFTFKDTNNGAIGNGPSVVYTKEVTDTETVELSNSNTGVHGTYPYFVFFVPNN